MKVHQIFSIVVMVVTLPSSAIADGNLRLGGTASSNTNEEGGGTESILSSEAMVQIQSLLEVAPEIADSFMMSDNDERMEMVQEAADQVKHFVESERGVMMREELMKSDNPQEALKVLSSMLVTELAKMLDDSGFRRLQDDPEEESLLVRLLDFFQLAVPLSLSARDNFNDIQQAFSDYKNGPNNPARLASFLEDLFEAISEFCFEVADELTVPNGGSSNGGNETRLLLEVLGEDGEDEPGLVSKVLDFFELLIDFVGKSGPIFDALMNTRDEVEGAFTDYKLEKTNANLFRGMGNAFLAVSDFFGVVADAVEVPLDEKNDLE